MQALCRRREPRGQHHDPCHECLALEEDWRRGKLYIPTLLEAGRVHTSWEVWPGKDEHANTNNAGGKTVDFRRCVARGEATGALLGRRPRGIGTDGRAGANRRLQRGGEGSGRSLVLWGFLPFLFPFLKFLNLPISHPLFRFPFHFFRGGSATKGRGGEDCGLRLYIT